MLRGSDTDASPLTLLKRLQTSADRTLSLFRQGKIRPAFRRVQLRHLVGEGGSGEDITTHQIKEANHRSPVEVQPVKLEPDAPV